MEMDRKERGRTLIGGEEAVAEAVEAEFLLASGESMAAPNPNCSLPRAKTIEPREAMSARVSFLFFFLFSFSFV